MKQWKVAAGVASVIALIAGAGLAGAVIQAQDRGGSDAPRAWAFQLAQGSGSQIGVQVQDADSGVLVEDVRSNSPAEKAGVKPDDVIVEFDGERVRSARQFSRLVDETPGGRTVKMAVQRGGQRTTLDVTPESRRFGGRIMPAPLERFHIPDPPLPPEFEEGFSNFRFHMGGGAGRLGVQLEEIEDQLAEYFGVKEGALITSVAKDTPAARAGLKAGDVITKVNGESVEDIGDVRRELRRVDPGSEVAIDVVRDRKPLSLKVKLDAPASGKRSGTPTGA